ncbi:MAG: hypothetical protein KDB14_34170 [Planctomycetales bacterium]|nr:hypothetical protein [Planctomycetales bacterium]
MRVQKAVITAASPGQRSLPLQNIVDRDGQPKTALQLILDEAVAAGIREICIVICPGDAPRYRQAACEHSGHLTFVEQDSPRGYGDALLRAAGFVEDEPFLHLVGDHLYISGNELGCAQQLIQLAQAEDCAVSAVQSTREHQLHLFGTVGGVRVAHSPGLYEITKVIEKPTPTFAEQELVVAGLRSSHYLCLFGLHVLTPTVMELLREQLGQAEQTGQNISLSPALNRLAERERYLAAEIEGKRFNIGVKYGLLMSQLALALSGKDRDDILTQLLELVASHREVATS